MKKVIQLRGTNGCGKTTAISQYIEKYNLKQDYIEVNGKKYSIFRNKNTIVIAKQKKDGGYLGLDGIVTDRNKVILLIYQILDKLKPDILIFEGVVYGVTFKFGYEVNSICIQKGYQYIGVCLYADFLLLRERIAIRNGGKLIKEDYLNEKLKRSIVAYNKLNKSGVTVYLENSGRYEKENMVNLLEKYV